MKKVKLHRPVVRRGDGRRGVIMKLSSPRRSFFTSLAKAAAIVLLCLTGCRKDETEFDCGLPGCLECESIRTARVPRVIYKTQIAGGTYLSFQKGGHIFISYNHGLIHDPNCGCMKGKP